MKEIWNKILDILENVPDINKTTMLGILAPLQTEKKVMTMLNYLEKNQNNTNLMKDDLIIKKHTLIF